jgi:hypothetical protein
VLAETTDPEVASVNLRVIDEVLADHAAFSAPRSSGAARTG